MPKADPEQRERLAQLRDIVDQCDEQLLTLIAKRQSAVRQLVSHKKKSGEAIFVPERERDILERLAKKAITKDVDPHLIQDILQRLMRDSYSQQSKMEYPMATSAKNICVIGGEGQFGQLLTQQFLRSGHHVQVLEHNQWEQSQQFFLNADLVLIAVPIEKTVPVIRLLENLPKDCVLADITSVKSAPVAEMLKIHKGPVIGLHPMFGPRLTHMARQLLLFSAGRDFDKCEWVIRQFELWGCQVQEINAADHDQLMALVQGLRHFVTFVAGWHLQKSGVDLERLSQVSSPIYRLELALIGRLFAQQPELYIDIILNANIESLSIADYGDIFNQAADWVVRGERDQLIQQFLDTADYFSNWKDEFLSQSDIVLESFRERVS